MKTFSLNNQLGDLLLKSRQQRQWSLRDAAEESGVSHTYISKLEKGLVPKPAPEQLKKIANAYDESYNLLMVLAGYKEEVQAPEQFVEADFIMDDLNEYIFDTDDYYNSLENVSISEPNQELLIFSEKKQETIGDRVKLIREKNTISINDLSEKMLGNNVHHDYTIHTKFAPSYIQEVEKGQKEPSISFLVAISKFFNVSMDWLATGKNYIGDLEDVDDEIIDTEDEIDLDLKEAVTEYVEANLESILKKAYYDIKVSKLKLNGDILKK